MEKNLKLEKIHTSLEGCQINIRTNNLSLKEEITKLRRSSSAIFNANDFLQNQIEQFPSTIETMSSMIEAELSKWTKVYNVDFNKIHEEFEKAILKKFKTAKAYEEEMAKDKHKNLLSKRPYVASLEMIRKEIATKSNDEINKIRSENLKTIQPAINKLKKNSNLKFELSEVTISSRNLIGSTLDNFIEYTKINEEVISFIQNSVEKITTLELLIQSARSFVSDKIDETEAQIKADFSRVNQMIDNYVKSYNKKIKVAIEESKTLSLKQELERIDKLENDLKLVRNSKIEVDKRRVNAEKIFLGAMNSYIEVIKELDINVINIIKFGRYIAKESKPINGVRVKTISNSVTIDSTSNHIFDILGQTKQQFIKTFELKKDLKKVLEVSIPSSAKELQKMVKNIKTTLK